MISDEYRQMNADLHEQKPMYGMSGRKWAPTVMALREKYDTVSVLDYGCGKGSLGKEIPGGVTNYDPAIKEFSRPPKPHNIVVCTDVLEHVEPQHLSAVLGHISELTRKVALLVVATRPARKTLPDGRNCHLIIRSAGWWVDMIDIFMHIEQVNIHKANGDLIIFAKPREESK